MGRTRNDDEKDELAVADLIREEMLSPVGTKVLIGFEGLVGRLSRLLSAKGDCRKGLLRAAAIAENVRHKWNGDDGVRGAHAVLNALLAEANGSRGGYESFTDPATGELLYRPRSGDEVKVPAPVIAERETPRKDSDSGWATGLEAAMVKSGIFEMTIIRGPDGGGIIRTRGVGVDPNSVSLHEDVTPRRQAIVQEIVYVSDLASAIEDIFKWIEGPRNRQ